MLVLSRKIGEKIVLPTLNIEVTVVAVRGDKIRLGVQAPPEIPVDREEIAEKKRRNEITDKTPVGG